ncbi:MAG: alpha/beta fold hydrolase [Chloroflexi bacterium]|nr:alpha/beta fold hydrolase [Chloroflexota bacterium]
MAALLNHTQGYLDVGGAQLHYEAAGEGHPLTLIHAGVADLSMWDDQFHLFAQRYRVIRYDVRGYGKSFTGDVPFSNRHDLYLLLEHLGVSKSYLLGLSRGAQIATDFTLERPGMVDALITCAPGLSGLEPQATEIEMQIIDEMMQAIEAGDFPRLASLDVQMWADGPGQPRGRAGNHTGERVFRMSLDNYTKHAVEGQPQVLEPPAIGRLAEIQAPTLVIAGDLDASGVTVAADRLAQGIAGAKKVVVPGTAHMINLEKPQEFNKVVLDFLATSSEE